MLKKLRPYIVSVGIALAVGALSALVSMHSMTVYENVTKPPFSPPSWLFPVVWTILYVLMGIGAGLVKTSGEPGTAKALSVYAAQLAVNFFWPVLFFRLEAFWVAFAWLLLLWVLILVMIVLFHRVRPLAARLQIPYLIWVTFAAYLNLGVAILN